jgi:hypothetical protein
MWKSHQASLYRGSVCWGIGELDNALALTAPAGELVADARTDRNPAVFIRALRSQGIRSPEGRAAASQTGLIDNSART